LRANLLRIDLKMQILEVKPPQILMAKTKNTGGTKLGRDPRPKYLGVKLYDGQPAKIGSVIVRQRGTSIIAGKNVKTGNDKTLYAAAAGTVKFRTIRKKSFSGTQRTVKVAEIIETKTAAKAVE